MFMELEKCISEKFLSEFTKIVYLRAIRDTSIRWTYFSK